MFTVGQPGSLFWKCSGRNWTCAVGQCGAGDTALVLTRVKYKNTSTHTPEMWLMHCAAGWPSWFWTGMNGFFFFFFFFAAPQSEAGGAVLIFSNSKQTRHHRRAGVEQWSDPPGQSASLQTWFRKITYRKIFHVKHSLSTGRPDKQSSVAFKHFCVIKL